MNVINDTGAPADYKTGPPELEDLAQRIVDGFLVPACRYEPAPGKGFDPHERWKHVRDAAAVIAGWAWHFCRLDEDVETEAAGLAQEVVDEALRRLAAGMTYATMEAVRMHGMIAGKKGLAPRAFEALRRLLGLSELEVGR